MAEPEAANAERAPKRVVALARYSRRPSGCSLPSGFAFGPATSTLTSDDGIRFKTGGESASSRLPGDVAEASGSSLGPVGDVDGEKDFNRASRMRASLIRACESKF